MLRAPAAIAVWGSYGGGVGVDDGTVAWEHGLAGRHAREVVVELGSTAAWAYGEWGSVDRKSTRLNSSHIEPSRMPSSA